MSVKLHSITMEGGMIYVEIVVTPAEEKATVRFVGNLNTDLFFAYLSSKYLVVSPNHPPNSVLHRLCFRWNGKEAWARYYLNFRGGPEDIEMSIKVDGSKEISLRSKQVDDLLKESKRAEDELKIAVADLEREKRKQERSSRDTANGGIRAIVVGTAAGLVVAASGGIVLIALLSSWATAEGVNSGLRSRAGNKHAGRVRELNSEIDKLKERIRDIDKERESIRNSMQTKGIKVNLKPLPGAAPLK